MEKYSTNNTLTTEFNGSLKAESIMKTLNYKNRSMITAITTMLIIKILSNSNNNNNNNLTKTNNKMKYLIKKM